MQKPGKYDETEVKEFGDYKALPLGGHRMVIGKAYEGETTTFRPTLNLELDVAEKGEFEWYFSQLFQNDSSKDKKWPRGGCYSVITDDDEKTLPFLKGLITSIEKSNPGFTFNWSAGTAVQMKSLEGKLLGAVYGLEEYENDKGEVKTSRKIRFVRSIENIDKSAIPDVKLIDKTYVSYDDYCEKFEEKNEKVDKNLKEIEEKKQFINEKLSI